MMSKGFVLTTTVEDKDEDLHDAEMTVRDVGYDDANMIISVDVDNLNDKLLFTRDEALALIEALSVVVDRYSK